MMQRVLHHRVYLLLFKHDLVFSLEYDVSDRVRLDVHLCRNTRCCVNKL
ncbi:hypothetical protein THOD04_10527 [Vibrio owensii]|nr:hypothetical protein THOD04_10527 [Vibrio owensii]